MAFAAHGEWNHLSKFVIRGLSCAILELPKIIHVYSSLRAIAGIDINSINPSSESAESFECTLYGLKMEFGPHYGALTPSHRGTAHSIEECETRSVKW